MEEEYIPVWEDLPQIEKGYMFVSVNVIALTDEGEEIEAFLDEANMNWHGMKDGRKIAKDIVAWRSL